MLCAYIGHVRRTGPCMALHGAMDLESCDVESRIIGAVAFTIYAVRPAHEIIADPPMEVRCHVQVSLLLLVVFTGVCLEGAVAQLHRFAS